MTARKLRREVWAAHLELVKQGLVIHTWGNASGIDRDLGVMIIKPSGVDYETLQPEQMVVVSLDSGAVLEGKLRPSLDTPTHLELYRAFKQIGGIVHTHSLAATAWAQARRDLPPLGTTHADYFLGPVPCTRSLKPGEIKNDYEINTARAIIEAVRDPLTCPGVLVASHGPFAWGRTVTHAVHHAVVLEHLARLATQTLRVFPSTKPLHRVLLEQHFFRKHGPGARYGQPC